MSRIHPEGHDSDHPDRLLADVLLRQEPNEEENEEEDGGDGNGKDKEDVDDDDDGYSECACPLYFSGGRMKREHFVELVEEALDLLPQEFRSRKPSVANDRLALPDTQVETSDGEGVRRRCDCQINIVTAMDVSQVLTRTAPHATTLHIQAEGLHIISDGAFHLNTVGEPAVITVDFVIRQHRSLIFQDSDDRTFELPAFTSVPESAIVRAVDQEIFPSNHTS